MKRPKKQPTPVYDAYKTDEHFCEWRFWLGVTGCDDDTLKIDHEGVVLQRHLECNHIFSVNRRSDLQSNLIVLTAESHRYFHRHLPEGRVLSLICKMKKAAVRRDPGEFDHGQLVTAAGHNLLGLVESVRFEDAFLETGRRNLLSVISAIES